MSAAGAGRKAWTIKQHRRRGARLHGRTRERWPHLALSAGGGRQPVNSGARGGGPLCVGSRAWVDLVGLDCGSALHCGMNTSGTVRARWHGRDAMTRRGKHNEFTPTGLTCRTVVHPTPHLEGAGRRRARRRVVAALHALPDLALEGGTGTSVEQEGVRGTPQHAQCLPSLKPIQSPKNGPSPPRSCSRRPRVLGPAPAGNARCREGEARRRWDQTAARVKDCPCRVAVHRNPTWKAPGAGPSWPPPRGRPAGAPEAPRGGRQGPDVEQEQWGARRSMRSRCLPNKRALTSSMSSSWPPTAAEAGSCTTCWPAGGWGDGAPMRRRLCWQR